MRTAALSAVLTSVLLVACHRNPQTCAPGCESNLWPRLIVGLLPPSPDRRDGVDVVAMRVRNAAGKTFEAIPHGCPDIAGVVCTYSFFSTPADRSVTVLLEPRDPRGPATETEIPLGPFNACGRDITYARFTRSGASWKLLDWRRLSPCERP